MTNSEQIIQVTSAKDVDQVRALLNEYIAFASSISPGINSVPAFKGYEDEFAKLPGIYAPPTGRLLMALEDSQPAGCVALKRIGPDVCELKRLYVRPQFRGKKIGSKLVEMLVDEARKMGYSKMVLDSHKSMKSAHRIYQEVGFRFVEAPADFPERLRNEVVFMELALQKPSLP